MSVYCKLYGARQYTTVAILTCDEKRRFERKVADNFERIHSEGSVGVDDIATIGIERSLTSDKFEVLKQTTASLEHFYISTPAR